MPDAAGAAGFSQQLGAGVSRTTIATAILTSAEGRADEVQFMYQRFLRRESDVSGATAFANSLRKGMSDGMVEAALIGSEEYKNHS